MRTAMTDGELLASYAQGDQDAFAAVVERHMPLVLGVCRRIGHPSDAEDAAQAVFVVLATKAAGLTAHSQLGGWLHRTSTHIALRQRAAMRSRRRHEQAAGSLAGEDVPMSVPASDT